MLDLARDLPTTPEDTAALRRVKRTGSLTLEAYLRFLEQLPPPAPGVLRAKPGPRGDGAFEIA
ncbi:MAG: hypothetical protein GTO30_06265 [Acidobacteria bacterium]|nr:hypothetical protein [Acidobacteriota bacterium]NIM61260.1 hypothetical protein [Acidobacteriota bacterium]NIQ86663.1 hypothetical protein [Acidobacteriota bacterium]NIT12020.1 hypothetical protein [Acidobacteriota bacterium]